MSEKSFSVLLFLIWNFIYILLSA